MEFVLETLSSKNIFVWIFVLIAFVLFIKFLQAAGKGFLFLVGLILVIVIVSNAFPDFVEPFTKFVRGGWISED